MNFWQLLRHPRLSRLLLVRWIGQGTDGIFQGALATFVLFSPERQASALSAALAFAVVLLPYSIIGPFVGTVLDRVSRQRALFISNFSRALDLILIALLVFTGRTGLELTVLVLIAFGLNRLILAATSFSLRWWLRPRATRTTRLGGNCRSCRCLFNYCGELWLCAGFNNGAAFTQIRNWSIRT